MIGAKTKPSRCWNERSLYPNQLPAQPSIPLASATSATKASTIAPTATASFTPVCAPCAAASITLAGRSPSSKASATSTSCGVPSLMAAGPSALMRPRGRASSPSASGEASATSGMMIFAIRMPPGADMKAAASRKGRYSLPSRPAYAARIVPATPAMPTVISVNRRLGESAAR